MDNETTPEVPEQVDAPDVETQEPIKSHPAHEKLLSELPEAWHQKVLPHLQEQDKFYQQEMEKYNGYKEFVDAGISPDVLRGGVNLAKAIESQPMDVYDSLTTYLKQNGLLTEDAKQTAREIMEDESGEDFEDMFENEKISPALQREIDQLKNFQTEQQEYMYNQQLEKETTSELARLETDMAQAKSQYNISEAHEVAVYDLMNAALNAGREVTVADAVRQLSAMIPGGLAPVGSRTPGEPAPTVVGSAGGAGIQAQNLRVPKDDDAKRAMLEQMFNEYKKSNQ